MKPKSNIAKRGRPAGSKSLNTLKLKDKTKLLLIKVLNENGAIMSNACKRVKIHRSTFNNWYNDDLVFAAAVDEARLNAVEDVESCLYSQILSGSTVAMIFYLKCRGKWQEKNELDINVNQIRIKYVMPPDDQPVIKINDIKNEEG